MKFDSNTWRPTGWQSGLAPLDSVIRAAAEARARKKRREPLTLADFAAMSDAKLLADSYATPRWVWRLAGLLCGVEPGEWSGDPFHNPWARGADEYLAPDAWRFDGSTPDLDGLRTYQGAEDIGPELGHDAPAWPGTGPLLVNGPHSDNGAWLPLCAAAGRSRIVVAVVPSDAVGWYIEHGMQCDFEVQLGRLDYDPPPGLSITGNERCSSLLIWHPESREDPIAPAMVHIRDDKGKVRRCPVRPALRNPPAVIDWTEDGQ